MISRVVVSCSRVSGDLGGGVSFLGRKGKVQVSKRVQSISVRMFASRVCRIRVSVFKAQVWEEKREEI